ncbi:MAG: tyrosine-type recombinase/integrase [Ilumatobacteraceae bacterium]
MRSVRAYVGEVADRSAWSAFGAVRALKAWSRFCVDDLGLDADPLAALEYCEEPSTFRTPVAELSDIDALLATCSGDALEDVRDRAIFCLLRATSMRRGELIKMTWANLDMDECTVHLPPADVKNGKGRTVAFDTETRALALRKYVQRLDRFERDNGIRGFVELPNGVAQPAGRVRWPASNRWPSLRRARLAGVEVTAHSFRRSIAMRRLRTGGSETLLMKTTG